MSAASEITNKAGSNLAFALKVLPKDRREDMTVFYAFCRTIDDLADDTEVSVSDKSKALDAWAEGLLNGFPEHCLLGCETERMIRRRGINPNLLIEIIDGCKMDLNPQHFGSWEDLMKYNWKVAGVVGLVSTRIFGCVHENSDEYAKTLGNALQLTNILRDVGEDLSNGRRIYLPENDLIRFQYSERDLTGRVYDGRFISMMRYQAERVEYLHREAEKLIAPVDRKALLPAQIMAEVYKSLLVKMKADDFKVFDRRYSVSKIRKLAILSKFFFVNQMRERKDRA